MEPVLPRRRLPVITGILVLIALAILISLGTWQVERLHWKEGLLADIAARQVAAPVPLADIEAMAASGGDIEYRKVTATGRYINNKERHFFATWRGQTGFYVYTPLELADGRALLVNRGFVPYENKEPEMRMQGQLTDQQTVTGLAREKLPGKPSWVVPDNDVAKNIFYWKDLDVMAESVGLEKARVIPFFVDADSTPNPAGLPIGGVTQVDLPNDHLQYAFTWYGLAAVLVAVVAISWFRKPGKQTRQ
ncbi:MULTISPECIES: SURF1 family protein [unclassified Rhizobium]|nr:surfeit locus 1 family protein [Rhizobium sp. N324]ANM15941.1 surfeit locus 1 family protein [Rhizobium sp. N541]ANM22329.1 surfeit locus 1 family protein [Rhizobium sp. N941]OYD03038.1 surfeit locus 1 family protein [Rhizobium sp. N4311]